jgi:hypothetical protein
MTTLIFLFALLTTPTDKYICDLWTRAITREGFLAACGTLLLDGYRVDVYDLEMKPICQMDAVYFNDIEEMKIICEMDKPLDEYVLRMVQPGFTELICFVESIHADAPTRDEITAQCPQAKIDMYTVEPAGIKPPETPMKPFTCPVQTLNIGFGLYEQSPNADALLSDESLTWLAGKLIWNGVVKPQCGGSGLDPFTLAADPCGMAFARADVIRWQNQFNDAIFTSAVAYNVPARLLKRMMNIESQFWPFYTAPAGEIGVMQITDNGLDTLLRFDKEFDPFYFERDDLNKFWSRSITRDKLYCLSCTLEEAIAHIKTNMDIYARLLAAFHCRAVTINPALLEQGDLAWRQAVLDYNGSEDYLARIEQP